MVCRISPLGTPIFGFGYGYQLAEGHMNLADGRWHHVAAAYTGGETRRLQLYADGEAEATVVSAEPANLGAGSP